MQQIANVRADPRHHTLVLDEKAGAVSTAEPIEHDCVWILGGCGQLHAKVMPSRVPSSECLHRVR